MILYTGEKMHERDGCWGDRGGRECGEPTVMLDLCASCYVRLGGERPVMPIPAPDSEAFRTGAGRR